MFLSQNGRNSNFKLAIEQENYVELLQDFYSCQLTHNYIIPLEYMICLLTEHRIVLSQAEQFDVLELYKARTQDILLFVLFWVN